MKIMMRSYFLLVTLLLFTVGNLLTACSSNAPVPTPSMVSVEQTPLDAGNNVGAGKTSTATPSKSTPSSSASNTATRLNEKLPQGGDVSEKYQVSSNGKYAVYIADATINDIDELYSVPLNGGRTIKLNGELEKRQHVDSFMISPDGNSVVYLVKAANADAALYSVPIGGGKPAKLTLPLKSPLIQRYLISPDGGYVLYTGKFQDDEGVALYSVPVAGGTPTRLSNPAFTEDDQNYVMDDYKVSADGKLVVFRENSRYLYSVPVGGGMTTKLSDEEQMVEGFKISPDSSFVLFKVRDWEKSISMLYTIPIGGGTPTNMTAQLTGDGVYDHVRDSFTVSPDNHWIVFIARQEANNYRRELYSVPVDKPGTLIKLNHPIEEPRNIYTFTISMDAKYVVYETHEEPLDYSDLYSVPIGGGKAERLNVVPAPNHPRLVKDFAISPDSKRVVLLCECADDLAAVYSAPITGPESATVKLNSWSMTDQPISLNFAISLDSSRVFYVEYPYVPYAGYYTYRPLWLMSAPIGGGTSTFVGGPKASSFVFSPDGKQVIFRSSHETPSGSVDQYNLYIAPTQGKR